jgi:hypothetical protein
LKAEDANVYVMMVVFTSVMETLNDTKHHISKTNGGIWMKLNSYGTNIRKYQTTWKTLL